MLLRSRLAGAVQLLLELELASDLSESEHRAGRLDGREWRLDTGVQRKQRADAILHCFTGSSSTTREPPPRFARRCDDLLTPSLSSQTLLPSLQSLRPQMARTYVPCAHSNAHR